MVVVEWGRTADRARHTVPDQAIDACWRVLNYLCAAQLYLDDNPRLDRPLRASDIKPSPRGHWGVCPPVNYLLAHLGPLTAQRPTESELLILHGAGHANPSVLAHAYLNATLPLTKDGPGWSMPALRRLIADFPHQERFGAEITPLIPGVRHTGGQLGPALSIAQGMVLDAPHRLVIPLIGDGELETGATAAAWLARRALAGPGHGTVLPVVLANGLRMGGPALLATMTQDQVRDYFTGLGYAPLFHDGAEVAGFRSVLTEAFTRLRPLGDTSPQPVVVLTMPKGHTGPDQVDGQQIRGTPAVHKTPLRDPRTRPAEFAALEAWLASYRPTDLLCAQGRPVEHVRRALPGAAPDPPRATTSPAPRKAPPPKRVSAVIREHAEEGAFRLFSPDEITSNRLDVSTDGSWPPWVVEILNEEICHGWLQGYTETGRNALLATYEAFAPVNTSLLLQHLKHRRLRHAAGHAGLPSINYLVTSLGWRNTYTHQNPGLASSLLEIQDETVHVYTPADHARAAAVLADMLAGHDQINLLITDKHPSPCFPADPLRDELNDGAALWPHYSRDGHPDLILASAGDIPARELSTAATRLRTTHPQVALRYLHVNDLAALGPALPNALSGASFARLFATHAPVLMAVPTYPGTVHALLAARGPADRFHVAGYQEPRRPTSPEGLLQHCGLSASALYDQATRMIKEHIR